MALVNWDDTQKEQFLRTQFNAQTNQYWETYPQSQYDIIEADGVAVGRIWTNQSDTELRILDITIAPHHRDKGIGSHIMRDLIAIGEAAALSIRFYVWQDNEPAQRFYQRHHFRAVRQDGAYILMER